MSLKADDVSVYADCLSREGCGGEKPSLANALARCQSLARSQFRVQEHPLPGSRVLSFSLNGVRYFQMCENAIGEAEHCGNPNATFEDIAAITEKLKEIPEDVRPYVSASCRDGEHIEGNLCVRDCPENQITVAANYKDRLSVLFDAVRSNNRICVTCQEWASVDPMRRGTGPFMVEGNECLSEEGCLPGLESVNGKCLVRCEKYQVRDPVSNECIFEDPQKACDICREKLQALKKWNTKVPDEKWGDCDAKTVRQKLRESKKATMEYLTKSIKRCDEKVRALNESESRFRWDCPGWGGIYTLGCEISRDVIEGLSPEYREILAGPKE